MSNDLMAVGAYLDDDPFGLDEETVGERRARILVENDLRLLWHLREIRETRGVSQAELAQRMGISQPTLAAFESQSNDPKLSSIRRYAHALGVVIDHSIQLDDQVSTCDWGSSQIVHLPTRRAPRSVARTGWRAG